jgi:hypothetical protein
MVLVERAVGVVVGAVSVAVLVRAGGVVGATSACFLRSRPLAGCFALAEHEARSTLLARAHVLGVYAEIQEKLKVQCKHRI